MTWLLAATIALAASAAWAHDNHKHEAAGPAPTAITPTTPDLPATAFPAALGGPFTLTDQSGRQIGDRDFRGRYMLVFFGYSRCESICPVGLSAMAAAVDLIGEGAEKVQPILITIDPGFDTPEALAEAAPKIHPRLIALTGSYDELAAVRKAYRVEAALAFTDAGGNPVYAHGSFIYLVGPAGKVLSVLPPILAPERIAAIVRRYLGGGAL